MTNRDKQIKNTLRKIEKALDDSCSYPVYKGSVIRIYDESELDWNTYKRLVDSVLSI